MHPCRFGILINTSQQAGEIQKPQVQFTSTLSQVSPLPPPVVSTRLTGPEEEVDAFLLAS